MFNRVLYQKTLRFLTIYCKQCSSLIRAYGASYRIWFAHFIPDLIELGKRMSKVPHMRNKNKKSRRYKRVCCKIMWHLLFQFRYEREKGTIIVFDKLVERLYAFDREMAFLLCDIVSDIVQDPRFKHIVPEGYEPELRIFFGVFFGKVKVSLFPPKNLSFYLSMFSAQCICARSNPRKRLLTTSGFIQILVRKFFISHIFARINPKYLENLLLK